jgi:hypothetical protein
MRKPFLVVFSAALILAGLGTSAVQAKTPECPRKLNDAEPGAALKPAVTLTPTAQSAQKQVNFGTDTDPKPIQDVRLTSNRALPESVTPAQINFEALISRSGDTLESTDFPDPTFTQPRISADRKAVTFTVCLDPEGISAGKYVGTITVSGPPGLSATSINLTVTAKNGSLFELGIVVAVVLCFVLLLFKDAVAWFKEPGDNWLNALKKPLIDMRWWAATVIGLGAAFGTLYAGYANDPAWGANGFAAVIALVGSGVAGIGGKSIISAFSKPSSDGK